MTVITIANLTLRPIEQEDAPRIAALCNDETLLRNTSRLPMPYTLNDAQQFVARSIREYANGAEYRFAICEDAALIACAGVMPTGDGVFELGYWVGADARGKGVATKAAAAIIHFAFEGLSAQSIAAGYFADNPASARVMEKLGFKPTGEIVQTMSLARGEEVETIRLALAPEDFIRPESIRIRQI